MSFFTFVWNATEYTCYLCIIGYSLLCFGAFGAKAQENAKNNSDGLLPAVLAILSRAVDQFNNTSSSNNRSSVPASRKK